ncbi:MAG: diphthine--ammonia ligase [archaeon]|nr:diphthine--ammonia ligase [archaeon]
MKPNNALLSWSGGKDSSLALYELRENEKFKDLQVKALLTTFTRDYNRISMHGVRRELVLAQSTSIGLPIEEVWIPSKATNEIYQSETIKSIMKWKEKEDTSSIVFGDLFLEDIRAYREKFLREIGIECVFPLWKKDTSELARLFLDYGFKAIICTVDPKKLDPEFCGRDYDHEFLSDIPESVDPCGENGEFHTFVYGGPIFKEKVQVMVGDIVEREGFYFADILPKSQTV